VMGQVNNSYIRSEGPMIAAIGLTDMVIVATDDAVLAATRDRAHEVKELVEHLKSSGRSEYSAHTKVYRPWGWYQTLETGVGFQVKLISLKSGAKISRQRHRHRAEHWVVVAGTASVTRGKEKLQLEENQSTFIPLGMIHRLENFAAEELRIVEVQSGDYLGEDDIERFEDSYGRN
ncbi:MAG: cupin domain-containing protein, partial [Rhodospirillales bacterium]|nr:cupin domain-containing protein [Rhodospirillales bacterium]